MSKPVKKMLIADLVGRYAGVESACVVDLTGLNVAEQGELRSRLREKSAQLRVVKNAMARVAFASGPLEPLGDVLSGPCALVTSSESLIDAAKVLVEAAKEFGTLKLKEALMDGDPQVLTVREVSAMKGRLEVLGDLSMLIASPGRAIAGCVSGPQSRIAGCLKAIADKEAA